jgi:hypothetical protein
MSEVRDHMIKENKVSICFSLASILLVLYLIFFLVPFAENNEMFSENESPQFAFAIKYFFLSTPIVVGYILFFLTNFNRIVFLRSVNYPLFVFNGYLGVVLCILVVGGAILWLVIPTLLIPLLVLPGSFIYGVTKDIQNYKKDKNNK